MPRKRPTGRLYWKDPKGKVAKVPTPGVDRAYIDLRDFVDVLPGTPYRPRMALIPEGASQATRDPDVADALKTEIVKELEKARRDKALGVSPTGYSWPLGKAVEEHLREKALEDVTDDWLAESEHMLSRAINFLGSDREVASITPKAVRDWIRHLGTLDNGRGGKLGGGTIRHHINCLSNFYGTAIEKGWATQNPVAGLKRGTKPKANTREAAWFEPHEAALVLDGAFRFKSPKPQVAIPFPGPLVATFLLTGGRKAEVLGLTPDDIAFDRNLVHFRPNQYRRLKTRNATRTVRLWPQLREVLQRHVFEDGHVSGLLFPSPAGTGMINDLEKMLDGVARFLGWEEGSIRSKMFRHTYCSARLQTFERVKVGEDPDGTPIMEAIPVSPFTVGREMGHGGDSLVRRVYGHLGTVRHRSEVVEYDLLQQRASLRRQAEDPKAHPGAADSLELLEAGMRQIGALR